MSKRGYVTLRNPEESQPRRTGRRSLRKLFSSKRGQRLGFPEEGNEGQDDGSDDLKMIDVSYSSPNLTTDSEDDENDDGNSRFSGDGDLTLPPFDDRGFGSTIAMQFRPSSPDQSSQLEVFTSQTSQYRRRVLSGLSSASHNVCVEEKWVWPWPEFSFEIDEEDGEEAAFGEYIGDSAAVDSAERKVRFADEEGKPIQRIRERPKDENPEWMTALILLLSPVNKKFEVIHISYNEDDSLRVSEVLKRIPDLATTPVLAEQTYTGFCRPLEKGVELINSVPIQDCCIGRDETLVANLEAMTSKQSVKLALPLLLNPGVRKTLKRHTSHGHRVHELTSDTFSCRRTDRRFKTELAEEASKKETLPDQAVKRSAPRRHPLQLKRSFTRKLRRGRDTPPPVTHDRACDDSDASSVKRDLDLDALQISEIREESDVVLPAQPVEPVKNPFRHVLGAGLLLGLTSTILRSPGRHQGQ